MNGLWLLAEANDDQSLTGEVTRYTVTVDPQPLLSGFFITLGAQQWFDDYLLVPNDATNLIISALYENDGTNAAGSGPIGIYLTNFDDLNLSDYGVSNISPPGGFLSLGTNDPVPGWPGSPPLSGGVWYFGIYNAGTASATLFVQVQVQESLTPNLVQYYTNSGVPVPLTTDAHTQTQICINNSQQLVSLQVGVRINDTNLDDLVLHLISPEGTSVLLFENRGGTGATNLGLTLTNNSAIYTIFTENTNLTTTPIKFAVPPFAQTIIVPQATLWSNSFETVTNGVYTNGALLEGWLVTNDVVSIEDTNGTEFVTNDEVGIVADPNGDQFINDGVTNSLGSNYLALTSGHIMQTFGTTNAPFTSAAGFAITNGQPYELVFYAKPLGITHWWPADDNADDIIGGDNGTIPDTNNVTFDVGEVDRAFTFSGMPNNLNSNNNEVDFGTNVGNIGTNDFTVDFWIKQPPTATNLYGILEKRPECNANLSAWYIRVGPGAGFSAPPGDMTMVVNDNAGANLGVLIANQPINDGNFHHAAFTRNGLVLSIYIDGVLNTNLTNAGIANLSNSVMFRAGQSVCVPPSYGDLSDGSVPFVGSLDELDLYDRALSPAEIYAIYHAGSLGKYSTNSLLPNFDLTIDGISTNNIVLTNASGGWQLFTNSFVANSDQVTVEFQGNALGVLLDGIQLIQLPTTNYNNYYLPEEPLTPFVGENPQGCWTLDIWDTRNDSSQPTDGTLLGWTLEVTTSSTNAVLTVLTNDLPVTNVVPTNSISYFAVDVPSYVTFATNILTVISGGPLTLFFDQTALPTGGQPGDVTLTNGVVVANSPSTTVLSTEGAPPPLLPGQRYFLGVQNNSTSNATFSIEVDFNGLTGLITPLTNGIAYSNVIGTNAIGTNGPQYYSFVVPTNAVSATFQILNPSDGEVDLYARDGLPLPGPSSFDYESQNAGSNDQFIVVTTNSVPVPLPLVSTNDVVPLQPSVWYLAAYNFAATNNIGYTIVATWVTTNQIASEIIPLTNGIPYTNTAIPGYTNVLYSFTVTNSPAGVQFTVTNLTNSGNVELLADLDIYPTPQEFYSGSFNAGTAPQLVQIGTNSTLPNLNGVWYLSVPNTSVSNVLYTIEATNLLVGPVTGLPLIVKGSISAQAGHFTMTWAAVSGKTYEIQDSTNLVTWTVLTNITAQSATGTYTDPTPIAGEKARYYRLLLVTTQSLNLNGSITSPARDFKLTWTATPGENYEVDMSTNLVTWTLLTNITVQSGTGSFTDTSPVTGHTARFYRVLPP
jgi:subtilisin-like proprotein convertase family protein